MKRHASLVCLSRQHHDALVLAQRLVLGHSTAPRAPWPTNRCRQARLLLQFFETTLGPHFDAEEVCVFPVVTAQVRGGAGMVAGLVGEHNDMRVQIEELKNNHQTRLGKRLPAFGKCLRQHIRTEERVLFERLQAEVTQDQLVAIGDELAGYYAASATNKTCTM